jgi:high affinity sulfate transporter 1
MRSSPLRRPQLSITAPIARWLIGYQPAWARADLTAGLTAAAVVIPQAMAYAALAGMPVQVGLYCSLAAMVVYPLLGGSRAMSVSTTSAIAMLTASEVATVTAAQPGLAPTAIAATLALLVGVFLLTARVLRLGFLANFISKPVLVGFQAGVGIAILVGQLKSVLGAHSTATSTIGALLQAPRMIAEAHLPTVLVAGVGVALLLGLRRVAPKAPAPLIWVAVSIVAAAAIGLEAHGVRSIGKVPSGMPGIVLPALSSIGRLWPGALGIALMSFTESMAAARTFRAPDDPAIDADRELIAIGAANLAASLLSGMPSGGGTSQTAVANEAGVRSQLAQWISAAAVLITLLFASGVISLMPQPALAAVIVVTGLTMIKPETFVAIARVRQDGLLWALATVAGVIAFGTLNGILVAVAISFLTLMYESNHPQVFTMTYDRKEDIFRRATEGDETTPGLLTLGTEGRLTFANAERVRDEMQALAAHTQPKVVVLECSAIPDIEYTALLMLIESEHRLRAAGVELWLAAVNPHLLKVIERSPLAATVRSERIFPTLRKAVEAWRRRRGRQGQGA